MADLAGLETFVAVARLGSLVRAAGALHRTQPSLSARIRSIEHAWGTKLFRRQARGMTLTPEGARLLPLAEAALEAASAVDRAAGVPVAGRDELRVGAGDALGREVLPRALRRLLAREPEISVRLVEGSAPRLLEALRAGEIDVALVASRAVSDTPAGVVTEEILATAIDLLLPAGGPAPSRSVRLGWLRDRRVVTLQPGSAFRRHLDEAFEAAGIRLRPAVEVGNLSLVRRFVAAGLGYAPVPSIAFPTVSPDPGIERRPLLGVPRLTYAMARRAGVPLGRAAVGLIQELRAR